MVHELVTALFSVIASNFGRNPLFHSSVVFVSVLEL